MGDSAGVKRETTPSAQEAKRQKADQDVEMDEPEIPWAGFVSLQAVPLQAVPWHNFCLLQGVPKEEEYALDLTDSAWNFANAHHRGEVQALLSARGPHLILGRARSERHDNFLDQLYVLQEQTGKLFAHFHEVGYSRSPRPMMRRGMWHGRGVRAAKWNSVHGSGGLGHGYNM